VCKIRDKIQENKQNYFSIAKLLYLHTGSRTQAKTMRHFFDNFRVKILVLGSVSESEFGKNNFWIQIRIPIRTKNLSDPQHFGGPGTFEKSNPNSNKNSPKKQQGLPVIIR
jgi:hypothetical protein